MYKNWRELLIEFHKYGYNPYLSTKIPLAEEDIKTLADMGIKDLQLSLDTLIDKNLTRILGVRTSYVEQIKHTLELLNKYHIKVFIHTVLNRLNDTPEDIKSIYDFIEKLDNIIEWKIDKAGSSLYLTENYDNIKPREENMEAIGLFTDSIKDKVNYPIRSVRPMNNNDVKDPKAGRSDFFKRGLCSGNYSGFFILPDGQVTLCEEFYWMPEFILGDITKNTLLEVWNSEKSKRLFDLPQEEYPKDSLCSSCKEFVKCRSVRQVCWKETVKVFGQDKWYYPDTNCPKLSSKVQK
ncbi:MAG: SPASM domain-containing protein [Bacteroides sp.]|nr:SPASM domain-containing protein [Bacteroides sp.]